MKLNKYYNIAFLLISLLFILVIESNFAQKTVKIEGKVIEKLSLLPITKYKVILTDKLENKETSITDTNGFFSFEKKILQKTILYLILKDNFFFNEEEVFVLDEISKDTFFIKPLTQIPRNVDWFPEIHFQNNTLIADTTNIIEIIDWMSKLANSLDNEQKLEITTYKDSLEKIDLRMKRAEIVKQMIFKKNVDKDKLSIRLIDKPNFIKPNEVVPDFKTKKYIETLITETYIKNSSVEIQDSLRNLNRSVSFEIINKKDQSIKN